MVRNGKSIHIGLFALKDLREGTELRYDYGVRHELWQQVLKLFDRCISFIGMHPSLSTPFNYPHWRPLSHILIVMR